MIEIKGEKYLTYKDVMEITGRSYIWVRKRIITASVKTFLIPGQFNVRFLKAEDLEKITGAVELSDGVSPTSLKYKKHLSARVKKLEDKKAKERRLRGDE